MQSYGFRVSRASFFVTLPSTYVTRGRVKKAEKAIIAAFRGWRQLFTSLVRVSESTSPWACILSNMLMKLVLS